MLGCLPLYLIARESGQVGEGNQVKLDNILRGGLFGHGSKKTDPTKSSVSIFMLERWIN